MSLASVRVVLVASAWYVFCLIEKVSRCCGMCRCILCDPMCWLDVECEVMRLRRTTLPFALPFKPEAFSLAEDNLPLAISAYLDMTGGRVSIRLKDVGN